MAKRISDVFKYKTPISAEQINQRVFINRANYKESILDLIFQEGVLIVSGYSGIGKTTFINLATAKRELTRTNAPFIGVVPTLADSQYDNGLLSGLYDYIPPRYSGGNKPEALTPRFLADIVNSNQLLLIVDGVNSLYGDPRSSKDLFNLCKTWTDIPQGSSSVTQSKIILVTSGLSSRIDEWLHQAGAGKRLPYEQIIIPPWNREDLLKIVEVGSQYLGVTFDHELQNWMVRVACGLPSTMTLLSALAAQRANNERDELAQDTALKVELSDLHGIFGEGGKFKKILYYDPAIEGLSIPALLALYMLGIHGGCLGEEKVRAFLDEHNFNSAGLPREIENLIRVENNHEVLWNLNELSYGTFAFLRLYFLSNRWGDDNALQITKVLNILNEPEPADTDGQDDTAGKK